MLSALSLAAPSTPVSLYTSASTLSLLVPLQLLGACLLFNCLISPLFCRLQVSPLQPLGFTSFYTLWTPTHPFNRWVSPLPLSLQVSFFPCSPRVSPFPSTFQSSLLPSIPQLSLLPPFSPLLYILQFSPLPPFSPLSSSSSSPCNLPPGAQLPLTPSKPSPTPSPPLLPSIRGPLSHPIPREVGEEGPSSSSPQAPGPHLPPPGAERGLSPDPLCLGGPAEPPYMRSPRL